MLTAAFPLAQLGRLERVIDALGTVPRKVAEYAAPEITKLLQREFSAGQDPHGRRWKKLATGAPSHLTKSRKLRSGTRATRMPGGRMGVRIILGAAYGRFHQTGTRNMPARRILPDKGMPASWAVAMKRAHQKAVAAARRAA